MRNCLIAWLNVFMLQYNIRKQFGGRRSCSIYANFSLIYTKLLLLEKWKQIIVIKAFFQAQTQHWIQLSKAWRFPNYHISIHIHLEKSLSQQAAQFMKSPLIWNMKSVSKKCTNIKYCQFLSIQYFLKRRFTDVFLKMQLRFVFSECSLDF